MGLFISAFLIALIFTLIFSFGFEKQREASALGVFFALLFLPLLALGLFIPPVGPVYYGAAWFDIFFFALLLSLFIGAASPQNVRHVKGGVNPRDGERNVEYLDDISAKTYDRGPGYFFWGFCVLLLLAIIFSGRWG